MVDPSSDERSSSAKISNLLAEVMIDEGPGDVDLLLERLFDRGYDSIMVMGLYVPVDREKVMIILTEDERFVADPEGRWHLTTQAGKYEYR